MAREQPFEVSLPQGFGCPVWFCRINEAERMISVCYPQMSEGIHIYPRMVPDLLVSPNPVFRTAAQFLLFSRWTEWVVRE